MTSDCRAHAPISQGPAASPHVSQKTTTESTSASTEKATTTTTAPEAHGSCSHLDAISQNAYSPFVEARRHTRLFPSPYLQLSNPHEMIHFGFGICDVVSCQ